MQQARDRLAAEFVRGASDFIAEVERLVPD